MLERSAFGRGQPARRRPRSGAAPATPARRPTGAAHPRPTLRPCAGGKAQSSQLNGLGRAVCRASKVFGQVGDQLGAALMSRSLVPGREARRRLDAERHLDRHTLAGPVPIMIDRPPQPLDVRAGHASVSHRVRGPPQPLRLGRRRSHATTRPTANGVRVTSTDPRRIDARHPAGPAPEERAPAQKKFRRNSRLNARAYPAGPTGEGGRDLHPPPPLERRGSRRRSPAFGPDPEARPSSQDPPRGVLPRADDAMPLQRVAKGPLG